MNLTDALLDSKEPARKKFLEVEEARSIKLVKLSAGEPHNDSSFVLYIDPENDFKILKADRVSFDGTTAEHLVLGKRNISILQAVVRAAVSKGTQPDIPQPESLVTI